MARLIEKPKEEHLSYLRSLIITKFTKPIVNTNDCKILEEKILTVCNQRLSVDTLARLFLIKKGNTNPSIFTLDICSYFVGYKNWKDLTTSYQNQNNLYQKSLLIELISNDISFDELKFKIEKIQKSNELYDLFTQIILIKYNQKDKYFFENLFSFNLIFEFNEVYKYNIYHIIHLLGSLCLKSKWLERIAISNYYDLPYNEDYFVEWLVVPNEKYYQILLDNYYKINFQNNEKKLFYHLIQITKEKDFLIFNDFDYHYTEIKEILSSTKRINNILQMRVLGIELLYYKKYPKSNNVDYIYKKIFTSDAINSNDAGHRVSSIFIIIQYLIYTESYDFIIKLYEKKVFKYSNILGYWAELNFNQLKVYYTYALVKTNQITKAYLCFLEINPDKFDLNFKSDVLKLYNYLHLKLQ